MTATMRTEDFKDLTFHLLCAECEHLFAKNGESPVLKWIAPKARSFPILNLMKVAMPRERGKGWDRYSGVDLGIETKPFAYFALSIVWRGAVHSWSLPDGQRTTLLDLGEFEEPIRQYLRGTHPFPDNVSVMVTVCSDPASRLLWFTPSPAERQDLEFGMVTRGIYFRIVLNRHMDQVLRMHSCHSNGLRTIFLSDCEKHNERVINLFPAPHCKK